MQVQSPQNQITSHVIKRTYTKTTRNSQYQLLHDRKQLKLLQTKQNQYQSHYDKHKSVTHYAFETTLRVKKNYYQLSFTEIMSTRRKKRQKSGTEEEMSNNPKDTEMEDISDDETVAQTNHDTTKGSFTEVSFLKISVKVPKALKATSMMKTKLQEVIKCLRDADNTVVLSHYKLDPTKDKDGFIKNKTNTILINDTEIPESITAIGKFFQGSRPRSEGGVIWTQIRILHNEPIHNIIADTRTEIKEMNAFIALQAIQHWNVETIGFLKKLHPDVDNESIQTYFTDEINALHKKDKKLLLGIKVRTPYDGIRRDTNKQPKFKDRVQAFHIDVVGDTREEVTRYLKTILASEEFQKRYKAPVRLVPTYDRRGSPNTQEKIKRCILQHSQFCQSVTSMPCQGIPSLELRNRSLKKTMRQLIMELPETHFINIDSNWANTNYIILFPRKYEEIAKEKTVHLAAFLHKEYGDKLLSSFEPETQKLIKETTWDEDNKPISKLDRELDAIIDSDDKLDYVDMTHFQEQDSKLTASTNPSTIFEPKLTEQAPVPFIPAVDDDTVSTFGTMASRSPGELSNDSISIAKTSSSEMSMVSVMSRVSKVEESMGDMKSMLQQILSAQTNRTEKPTQASCSQKAGEPKGSSASRG